MRELQARAKMKRMIYSLPALFVLLLITIGLIRGAYLLIVKERESARNAELLKDKVIALKEREYVLKKEIQSLHTDAGIEEEIKGRYNVAKPGERVAVIIDDEEATTTEPQIEPWYKRLWNAILGR